MNTPAEQYWQQYLATLSEDHAHHRATYEAWYFTDNPADALELGILAKQGVKQATASSAWEYEHDDEPLPVPGNISIITDFEGTPLCIIDTTEINIQPFNEVDEQFAYDEGEGDRSLAYWHRVHYRYFSKACERIGRNFTETMPVVCERFRTIYTADPV